MVGGNAEYADNDDDEYDGGDGANDCDDASYESGHEDDNADDGAYWIVIEYSRLIRSDAG